jgi:hypothetical protein
MRRQDKVGKFEAEPPVDTGSDVSFFQACRFPSAGPDVMTSRTVNSEECRAARGVVSILGWPTKTIIVEGDTDLISMDVFRGCELICLRTRLVKITFARHLIDCAPYPL